LIVESLVTIFGDHSFYAFAPPLLLLSPPTSS
jgi:hypothetical protein